MLVPLDMPCIFYSTDDDLKSILVFVSTKNTHAVCKKIILKHATALNTFVLTLCYKTGSAYFNITRSNIPITEDRVMANLLHNSI